GAGTVIAHGNARPAATGAGDTAPAPSCMSRLLRRLAEPVDELAGVAADRRVEHLDVQRILRVDQRVAGTVDHEAGRFDFLLHHFRIDAVQRVGVTDAGT